jgi:hypothetical protein
MDQATQQNAALVEESAAAAASLRTQAEQLVQAVAVFRLGASAGAPRADMGPAATQAIRQAPGQGGTRPVRAGAASSLAAADRRGPARATNVTRLPATRLGGGTGSAPAAGHSGTGPSALAGRKAVPATNTLSTGTNDAWESF